MSSTEIHSGFSTQNMFKKSIFSLSFTLSALPLATLKKSIQEKPVPILCGSDTTYIDYTLKLGKYL